MIGRTTMPGVCMSTSRKVIPAWRLPSLRVLTSRNIQLAFWACVVQIFVPSIT